MQIQSLSNKINDDEMHNRELHHKLVDLNIQQRAEINKKFKAIEEIQRLEDKKETLDMLMQQYMNILVIISEKYNNLITGADEKLWDAAITKYGHNIQLYNQHKQDDNKWSGSSPVQGINR